jgi:hypothetical protein
MMITEKAVIAYCTRAYGDSSLFLQKMMADELKDRLMRAKPSTIRSQDLFRTGRPVRSRRREKTARTDKLEDDRYLYVLRHGVLLTVLNVPGTDRVADALYPAKDLKSDKVWPLFETERRIPYSAGQGSFWENRGDRYHCGIDLYAPQGTPVLATEDARVVDVGIATTPAKNAYWQPTRYALVKNVTGLFVRYAELGDLCVEPGDILDKDERLGSIANVLAPERIGLNAPSYIKALADRSSMLHLELWTGEPQNADALYSGGNWFGIKRPQGLRDPTSYLEQIINS